MRIKAPRIWRNVIQLGVIAKPVRGLVVAISFCLGDSHASVSTGSE